MRKSRLSQYKQNRLIELFVAGTTAPKSIVNHVPLLRQSLGSSPTPLIKLPRQGKALDAPQALVSVTA